MATVRYEGAVRVYPGADSPAVDHLDLEVAHGEFLVLVGPSGCGKSTSLRMLGGLEPCDSGSVSIDGRDVTGLLPKDRDVAMVFQNYALYPHMTVAENIGYHLRLQRRSKAEIRERVASTAELLGLTDFLGRRPAQLSGGQRQRVAMGRAIVRRPKVFLMDEPLSNLDAKLRVKTRAQIASLQRSLGVTTLYVTHDQVEAMTMGDRVAVLHEGVLQDCATPRELYARPANVFVAGFIGSPAMNLVEAEAHAGQVCIGELALPLPPSAGPALEGRRVVAGIRPEHLVLTGDGAAGLAGVVEVVEDLGSDAYSYVSVEQRADPLVARCDPRGLPVRGDRVRVTAASADLHLFDVDTGERIDC